MAEPRRAAATAPRFEGGRFLIVEARYYDAIGADLLAGATRAIEAASAAYDLVSVAGALGIPARAWRSLSMLRKRQVALMTERSRWAVSCGAKPFILRLSPASSARALMDMSVERRTNALMISQRVRDRDWNSYVKKLADAANKAYRAAEAHDLKSISEVSDQLDGICAACHHHYGFE